MDLMLTKIILGKLATVHSEILRQVINIHTTVCWNKSILSVWKSKRCLKVCLLQMFFKFCILPVQNRHWAYFLSSLHVSLMRKVPKVSLGQLWWPPCCKCWMFTVPFAKLNCSCSDLNRSHSPSWGQKTKSWLGMLGLCPGFAIIEF